MTVVSMNYLLEAGVQFGHQKRRWNPKMKEYISSMIKNIAADCGVDESCVNVKATTEEGLGFTGALEGISAHAFCVIINMLAM